VVAVPDTELDQPHRPLQELDVVEHFSPGVLLRQQQHSAQFFRLLEDRNKVDLVRATRLQHPPKAVEVEVAVTLAAVEAIAMVEHQTVVVEEVLATQTLPAFQLLIALLVRVELLHRLHLLVEQTLPTTHSYLLMQVIQQLELASVATEIHLASLRLRVETA
jgi:hypothetical protein